MTTVVVRSSVMATTPQRRRPGRELVDLVMRLAEADAETELASIASRIVSTAEWQRAVADPDVELDVGVAGRVARVAELLAHAEKVWGALDLARQFILGRQHLLGAAPLDLVVNDSAGSEKVQALLGQIDHGIAV